MEHTYNLLCCDRYGKALSALGTATLDDETTIFGSHANEKTMGTLTRYIAGLKSPFHIINPL